MIERARSAGERLLDGEIVSREELEAEIAASMSVRSVIRAPDVVDAMIRHRAFHLIRWTDEDGRELLVMLRLDRRRID